MNYTEEPQYTPIEDSPNWKSVEQIASDLDFDLSLGEETKVDFSGEFVGTEGLEEKEKEYWDRVNLMLPTQWGEWFEERKENGRLLISKRVIRKGHLDTPKYNELARGLDPKRIGGLFSISEDAELDLRACLRTISLMESDEEDVRIRAAMLAMYCFSNVARAYEVPDLINRLEEKAFEVLDANGYREAQILWEETFGKETDFERARTEIHTELVISLEKIGIPKEAFSIVSREKNLLSFIQKSSAGRGHSDWLAFGIAVNEHMLFELPQYQYYKDLHGEGATAHLLMNVQKELVGASDSLIENEITLPAFATKEHHMDYRAVNSAIKTMHLIDSGYEGTIEVRLSGTEFERDLANHPRYKWAVEIERNLQVTDEDVVTLGDWALARLHSWHSGNGLEFRYEWTEAHLPALKYEEGSNRIPLCTERGGHTVVVDTTGMDILDMLAAFSEEINMRIARKVGAFDIVQPEYNAEGVLEQRRFRVVRDPKWTKMSTGVKKYEVYEFIGGHPIILSGSSFVIKPYASVTALRRNLDSHRYPRNYTKVVTVSEVLERVGEWGLKKNSDIDGIMEFISQRISAGPIEGLEDLVKDWSQRLVYYSDGLLISEIRDAAKEGLGFLEREVGAIVAISEAVEDIHAQLTTLRTAIRFSPESGIGVLNEIEKAGASEGLISLLSLFEEALKLEGSIVEEWRNSGNISAKHMGELKKSELVGKIEYFMKEINNCDLVGASDWKRNLKEHADLYNALPIFVELLRELGSLSLLEGDREVSEGYYSKQLEQNRESYRDIRSNIKLLKSVFAWRYLTEIVQDSGAYLKENILFPLYELETVEGRKRTLNIALRCQGAPGGNHLLYRDFLLLFSEFRSSPQNYPTVAELLLSSFKAGGDWKPEQIARLFGMSDVPPGIIAAVNWSLESKRKSRRSIATSTEAELEFIAVKGLAEVVSVQRGGIQMDVVDPDLRARKLGYSSALDFFQSLMDVNSEGEYLALLQWCEILNAQLRKAKKLAGLIEGFEIIYPKYPTEIEKDLKTMKGFLQENYNKERRIIRAKEKKIRRARRLYMIKYPPKEH